MNAILSRWLKAGDGNRSILITREGKFIQARLFVDGNEVCLSVPTGDAGEALDDLGKRIHAEALALTGLPA
jgi:hypothetical protein